MTPIKNPGRNCKSYIPTKQAKVVKPMMTY